MYLISPSIPPQTTQAISTAQATQQQPALPVVVPMVFAIRTINILTVAGGTSFAAPIFAGMLAIINQKENSTGQGLINSTLYTLAANSSTYSSAFHDITSGGNECTAGSSYCSSAGESKYYAGTGYDEASGLGSVDLYNLMTAWTAGSSASLNATTTALSAATARHPPEPATRSPSRYLRNRVSSPPRQPAH